MDGIDDRQSHAFSTRTEFERHLQSCLSGARHTLRLVDPDFALWNLGGSATDAALRHFLAGHGQLQLVAHSNAQLERHAPRLLRLLKDYGTRIECRLTHANLKQLTDSFCISDGQNMVRRFHSDHVRGEALFAALHDIEPWSERFDAIWHESGPGLQASTTGL